MFIIELPCPTKGIVGLNEVSWGNVDVNKLIEDIYDEVKNNNYPQCLICAKFIFKSKDRYGNDVEEKSDLHLIACLKPVEVRKYRNGRYLDEYYHITDRILSEAFGTN